MFEFQTVSVTFRANFISFNFQSGHQDMLQVPGCREKRIVSGETETKDQRVRQSFGHLVRD